MSQVLLYRLSQDENDDFDTYDSCVVAAKSADDARMTHPGLFGKDGFTWSEYGRWSFTPEGVKVELTGRNLRLFQRGVTG